MLVRKWDSEDKIGFMCYESSLNFNTSESSKQQYGIIFKNIQITTALSDNDNKTIESLNHSDGLFVFFLFIKFLFF